MPLIQSFKSGEFTSKLYEYKNLGYGYKIFTKINNQNTCVARSYAYIHRKEDCYNQMIDNLNAIMGIKQLLF